MKEQHVSIETDSSLMELRSHCSSEFPYQFYDEDIHAFQTGIIAWHWHREFEWKRIRQGSAVCRIGNDIIKLSQGDILFINSKCIHRFEAEQSCLASNFFFLPEVINPEQSLYEKYMVPLLEGEIAYLLFSEKKCSADIADCYRKIEQCFRQKKTGWDLQLLSLTSQLVMYLQTYLTEAVTMEKAGISKTANRRLRKMMSYINDYYPEKISLEDIALSANVSKTEAVRCFREMLGTTPVAYLNYRRMHAVQLLLLESSLTMNEIAMRTGFTTDSYLNRIFKKTFGMSPMRYRKNYRK